MHDSGAILFKKMQSSMRCLNTLLPPKKTTDYILRNGILVAFFLSAATAASMFLNVLLLIGVFLHYRYITVVI